jgi:hypothetical protein
LGGQLKLAIVPPHKEDLIPFLDYLRRQIERLNRVKASRDLGEVKKRLKELKEAAILGRLTAVNGQWNRSVAPPRGFPQGKGIDEGFLRVYPG